MRSSRTRRSLFFVGALLAVPVVALNLGVREPLRVDPLRTVGIPPVVDDQVELAYRHAPWIYHAVHPTRGRQDLPTRIDFDGDLHGSNNWENFPFYELPPTVYYTVVESETHWFLTYHLFHPRDWELLRFGLHLTHENDGENLQVVVDKDSEAVVLLFTQAHFRGGVYANPGSPFSAARKPIRGGFRLIGSDGVPADDAAHVAVFVEAHGHGIYATEDDASEVWVGSDGSARFARAGLVFRPMRAGESIGEPELDNSVPIPYRLESTLARLWPGFRDGSLVGENKLFDGTKQLHTLRIDVEVPRYYEADRFSGPLGPDKGISPFAVDFDFGEGEVGALLFDPAWRYAETLRIEGEWSREYVGYPF